MRTAALALAACGCHDFGALKPPDAAPADAPRSEAPLDAAHDAPGDVGPPPEAVVRIHDLRFDPSEITVPVGTTVRWLMEDAGTFHFVEEGMPMGAPGAFMSPRLDPGGEWVYTFTEPGTYVYFCSNHSTIMRNAMVHVK